MADWLYRLHDIQWALFLASSLNIHYDAYLQNKLGQVEGQKAATLVKTLCLHTVVLGHVEFLFICSVIFLVNVDAIGCQ